MTTKLQKGLIAATLMTLLATPTMAATLGSGAPDLTSTNYTWLTTTYNGAFALIPSEVKSQVNRQSMTTTYTVQVKEVPNPWAIRNDILPELYKEGIDISRYQDYNYSLVDYRIRVHYDYHTAKETEPSLKTYEVAKLSQEDFDSKGQALSPKRTYEEKFQAVEDGSDQYKIAYMLERAYYNPQIIEKEDSSATQK